MPHGSISSGSLYFETDGFNLSVEVCQITKDPHQYTASSIRQAIHTREKMHQLELTLIFYLSAVYVYRN